MSTETRTELEVFSFLATNPWSPFWVCQRCVLHGKCRTAFPCVDCAHYVFQGKLGEGRTSSYDGQIEYHDLLNVAKVVRFFNILKLVLWLTWISSDRGLLQVE